MQHRYGVRMIRTGTLEQAQANRRHLRPANGTGYWRSDLIQGNGSMLCVQFPC